MSPPTKFRCSEAGGPTERLFDRALVGACGRDENLERVRLVHRLAPLERQDAQRAGGEVLDVEVERLARRIADSSRRWTSCFGHVSQQHGGRPRHDDPAVGGQVADAHRRLAFVQDGG